MRGEDLSQCYRRTHPAGSPPHAWGRPNDLAPALRIDRFTPTCVGKTLAMAPAQSAQAVHPHMRGEDDAHGSGHAVLTGSPPHAWGRRAAGTSATSGLRFTPTCVGKTNTRFFYYSFDSVHPHMRGEYASALGSSCEKSGSPPHAWGRHQMA